MDACFAESVERSRCSRHERGNTAVAIARAAARPLDCGALGRKAGGQVSLIWRCTMNLLSRIAITLCAVAFVHAEGVASPATKTVYHAVCRGQTGRCIILAEGPNGSVHIPGHAKIEKVTIQAVVPPCTPPWTWGTSVFIFTNPDNPDEGIGWRNIGACVNQIEGTADVYADGDPQYRSYSAWQTP